MNAKERNKMEYPEKIYGIKVEDTIGVICTLHDDGDSVEYTRTDLIKDSKKPVDPVVRFADKNGMKMIKWKSGRITKECCFGCKFSDFKVWRDCGEDPCYPCDAHGSMKQI